MNPLLDKSLFHDANELAVRESTKGKNIVQFNSGDTAQSSQQMAIQEAQNAQATAQNAQGGNAASADANASFLMPKHSFAPTGFKYFDDKMAKGTLNVLDGYIARELLGLDLTKQLNINANINANIKGVSGTKTYNEIANSFNTLALGSKAADKSKGFVNPKDGFDRWANSVTSLWTLDEDGEAEFNVAQNQFALGMADTLAQGGRTTNMDKSNALKMFGAPMANRGQYISRVSEGMLATLNFLDTRIAEAEAKGYAVPDEILALRHYFDSKQRYMAQQGENYDGADFDKAYKQAFGDGSIEMINNYLQQLTGGR